MIRTQEQHLQHTRLAMVIDCLGSTSVAISQHLDDGKEHHLHIFEIAMIHRTMFRHLNVGQEHHVVLIN